MKSGILIIDDLLPDPSRDAGSNLILSHIQSLRRLGHPLYFLATWSDPTSTGPLASQIRHYGCLPLASPPLSFDEAIEFASSHLRYIYVQRPNNAVRTLAAVTSDFDGIIYGVVDLHHIRMRRHADLIASEEMRLQAEKMEAVEYGLMRRVRSVITPSSVEAKIIQQNLPTIELHTVAWDARTSRTARRGSTRKSIAFVGGYNHPANVDAATFLVKEIMPLVWAQHPSCKCVLAGSNMPDEIRLLSSENVEAVGFVDDLLGLFDTVTITVAPLRFGAGLKGKVIDSLASGVPCAMSAIAAEGFEFDAALSSVIGDDAASIAAIINSLLQDSERRYIISQAGLSFIRHHFSAGAIDGGLLRAFGSGLTRREDAAPNNRVSADKRAQVTDTADGLIKAHPSKNQEYAGTSMKNDRHDRLVIVDVGAAGGLEDRWENVRERVTAVLFEPNEKKAADLRAMPWAVANVIVVEKALAHITGSLKLHKTKSLGCWSLRHPNSVLLGDYSVAPAFDVKDTSWIDVTTYAELFREDKVPLPDVIKIDVQGFEFEVLVGFGDLLRHCVAIKLETHLYEIYQGQKLCHDIVRYLADFGFSLRRLLPTGKFDGDIVELDAWFTVSPSRVNMLDAAGKEKLRIVEQEWKLEPRRHEFVPNNWDFEWL